MPEPINLSGVATTQCRCLRSKEMFIGVEPDPSVPSMSSAIFWCTHTQNCLGPDGRVADLEGCKPGRLCFDPA